MPPRTTFSFPKWGSHGLFPLNFALFDFLNAFSKEGIKNRKKMFRKVETTICKQVFETSAQIQTPGKLSLRRKG